MTQGRLNQNLSFLCCGFAGGCNHAGHVVACITAQSRVYFASAVNERFANTSLNVLFKNEKISLFFPKRG